jgi:hypothetical protein
VTLLEIDTVRMDMGAAVRMYEDEVMPELREQPGYRGALVLTTPEGKGLLVTFWDREEDAEAAGETGFYPVTLERYMTWFRSPPGRERYEVALAELPVATAT